MPICGKVHNWLNGIPPIVGMYVWEHALIVPNSLHLKDFWHVWEGLTKKINSDHMDRNKRQNSLDFNYLCEALIIYYIIYLH